MGEGRKPYPVQVHTADPKHFGGSLTISPDPEFRRLSILYVGGTAQAVFSNPVVAEHFALMPSLLQAMAQLSDAASAFLVNPQSADAQQELQRANLAVQDILEQAADTSGEGADVTRDDGPLPASPTQRAANFH